MNETVSKDCQHKDCKYRSKGHGVETCDYILINHRSRGCKISECDKYETGKRKLVSTLGGFQYGEQYVDKDW